MWTNPKIKNVLDYVGAQQITIKKDHAVLATRRLPIMIASNDFLNDAFQMKTQAKFYKHSSEASTRQHLNSWFRRFWNLPFLVPFVGTYLKTTKPSEFWDEKIAKSKILQFLLAMAYLTSGIEAQLIGENCLVN